MKKPGLIPLTAILTLVFAVSACSARKSMMVSRQKLPANSSVIVVLDAPANAQNVVLARFMGKFRVKAFSASDIYTSKEIFDIKDFKKVAYTSDLKMDSLVSMQKAFENIYKLHVYNYELNKAESLGEMKDKWNVRYLVLLDLKDWQNVSWGRAIDLTTYELIWVENYATRYNDTLETVTDHFIEGLAGN